ncbi:mucosa-associated lymphoid tissue lymphoma translocation protein 1-like isoform X3 [Lagopus muta]|uniref:mucosa-associated lymphoid tissue lymphoma translocation protein 1-like isoform X3 n=1 Tax=Lagopus muta TaxID=64668 RepID=UPI00209F7A0D|nr:mucosa-associated lymphoid tissue lymphoma translocation protein 1-like isoform X3 [Lagopus muta]XP_048812281.1 mucosa-associated lymphoid tissue lymphoma translocation protein 1-like isoform X3 [Lagopus muta]
MQTAIVITEQPVSVSVPVGYSFTLHCRAEAHTSLQYQWFCQCQSVRYQIPGATKQDLPITAQQTQLYTCRINDLYRNVIFSDWVKVEVHPRVAGGLLPQLWQGEPVIILNPTEQKVEVGKPLQLQCAAVGVPAPSYQWYRNGNLLEHQKKKKLWVTLPRDGSETLATEISHTKVSDSGTYLCCASNSHGEHWTNAVDIRIDTCRSGKLFATGKLALLVGNNHYQHHPNLMAPVTDVFELSLLLKQLGFQVVSLLDLNKAEMVAAVSRFLQLLEKGVYAIFYYAGHGYEHLGRNYMVPVDAPQLYAPENCISVQRILQKMQQQQTALNLILLDTCRKWYNPECALSQVQPLEPWGNTVYGYATSEDAEAYELQDGQFSSGIFMKYLKKHILQEKKVTHMLEDVLEDLGRDPVVTGKQVMEIKHTLKEARSLTDPICPTGAATERWGCGHEPPSETVTFPCGVQAELRFHRLFSNVLSVCARLQHLPALLTDAQLMLRQPTEVDDVANLEESHPDQMDSLLTSVYKHEELDCVFQLCGLQKIQTDVVLQLDLHYTQLSTKQRTCESLQKILPKLLLGQFFTQRNYTRPSYDSAPARADPSGALRTGTGRSLPSSSPSKSSSEPEENDERSMSELCSALLQAGPGQEHP